MWGGCATRQRPLTLRIYARTPGVYARGQSKTRADIESCFTLTPESYGHVLRGLVNGGIDTRLIDAASTAHHFTARGSGMDSGHESHR